MAVRKKTSRTPTTSARATKIDFMKATNNIGKPVAAIAGFAVGKYALKKLSKSQTVTGLMGTDMKDYILPAAVTMGGLIGTVHQKRIHPAGLGGCGRCRCGSHHQESNRKDHPARIGGLNR